MKSIKNQHLAGYPTDAECINRVNEWVFHEETKVQIDLCYFKSRTMKTSQPCGAVPVKLFELIAGGSANQHKVCCAEVWARAVLTNPCLGCRAFVSQWRAAGGTHLLPNATAVERKRRIVPLLHQSGRKSMKWSRGVPVTVPLCHESLLTQEGSRPDPAATVNILCAEVVLFWTLCILAAFQDPQQRKIPL